MEKTETIVIRTGTMDVPYAQNYRIALDNFQAGRPLFEGQLPAVYVPDPTLPEWLTVKLID